MIRYCFLLLIGIMPLFGTETLPFLPGEYAVYDVIVSVRGPITLKGRAGKNTVSVVGYTNVRGKRAVHIKAVVESSPTISLIYKLRDEFHVYANTKTLVPYKIVKYIHEGSWTNTITIDVYADKLYAIYNDKRTKNKRVTFPQSNIHDILSMFFFMRTQDKENEASFVWYDNETIDDVTVRYVKGKTMRVPLLNNNEHIAITEAREVGGRGIRVRFARNFGYLPVYAFVPAFEVYAHHIGIRGVLVSYRPQYGMDIKTSNGR